MKLRIKDNTIRIRLSQSEVESLNADGSIYGATEFPGNRLEYGIRITKSGDMNAIFDDNRLELTFSDSEVEKWFESDQVGFGGDIDLENGSKLSILVEKDFKCLTIRSGEDESDMYPNPLQSH